MFSEELISIILLNSHTSSCTFDLVAHTKCGLRD